MKSGFGIGRLLGIDIRIDWSWLLIFFLVTWNLGTVFNQLHGNWSPTLAWLTGLVASLLFFASVLAHEMAHSLVARARGVPVRSITLFLFGGVSDIQREPPDPLSEFLITIVGPVTSFVLGVILLLLGGTGIPPLNDVGATENVVRQLNPLTTLLMWLGAINIILALFNMIPGFPLDGGRILRSILWAVTDNLRQATRWASWVGQGVAWLFILGGIAMVFGARIPLFGEGFINGLWLMFIGWFLNSAATQSYQRIVVQDVLENVKVSRIMRRDPPTVTASATLSRLVDDYVMQTDDYAFPVLDEEGRFVGLVTLEDVRSASRDVWGEKAVRDVMTPLDQLITVGPDEDAADALEKLTGRDVRQLPVVREAGELAGLFRRQDIVKWLQLHSVDMG